MLHIPAGTICFWGVFLLLFIYGYQIVRQIFMLPKNKVWRGIQEIPCQSVQLSIQSSPIHIFLIEKHLKFILDKNIAYDLRVCRDFYPVIWSSSRSLKENVQYSCSDHIFLCRNIETSYFTKRLLTTWGCVIILTQDH